MRHRKKKVIKLETGTQKRDLLVRNLLTSLVVSGHLVTTKRKAKVLKSVADSFFSRLLKMYDKYENESDAARENLRFVKSRIHGKAAGKKVIEELVPKYKKSGQPSFVADYNLGFRPGDASMKVLVKLL